MGMVKARQSYGRIQFNKNEGGMMSSLRYHNQGTNNWLPHARPLDPEARRAKYGPIRPMGYEERSWLSSLFSRR